MTNFFKGSRMKPGKTKYEQFQEWLSECPTQIFNYEDNGDHCIVKLDLPFEEDE